MALSVLRVRNTGPNTHILWSSETQTAMLKGTEDEMFDMKQAMETKEQQADNEAHRKMLLDKYLSMLTSGGHTIEEATNFLTAQMPKLFA